ncbi:DUF2779 domain-containing protein [Paracoccaceae bacterium]|nr:DUF2779 domain-containing protein [Paracoccaceae bacterium]
MILSKTDYLNFLHCAKSLWLSKHKPEEYPKKTISTYEDKLALEGYEVQRLVQDFLLKTPEAGSFSFEKTFTTDEGLYAQADIICENDDGTVNIYEVKSAGNIDKTHLIDATFQTVTVENSGLKVKAVYIVHLNKEYVRAGALEVDKMMSFSLVTEQVRGLIVETVKSMRLALEVLNRKEIDETSCSCLLLSKSHHCEAFDYFNPRVPKPSIYNLPRLHKNKILTFTKEGRLSLDEIDEDEVSPNQLNVLKAAKSNSPVINLDIIRKFYEQVEYPIHFLDYETYSSAIPIVEGMKPHAHIPFQYSIHIKKNEESAKLEHYQYLAEDAELPLSLIESMEKVIYDKGSVVSWHKSFENTRNKEMALLYPDKADFLNSVTERTIDLEDIFKGGYIDIAFGGSTSIKKVLPILVPELTYDSMTVANGTDAMEAFSKIIEWEDSTEKIKLKEDMLAYCKLDTFAMVKIFEKINEII